MPAVSDEKTLKTDWPGACSDFYDHWKALRGAAIMPSTERFLDAMPAQFVGGLYIADVTAQSAVVRFQGSALEKRWGADLTGQEMAAHRPRSLRVQLHEVMNTVASHPCGYFSWSRYVTSLQRLVDVHIIRLPLSIQAGRPNRTVNFTVQAYVLGPEEFAAENFESMHNTWVDIGAGLPATPPKRLQF